MTERTDRLFLELYDELKREVSGHELVTSLVRKAAGGEWHASEWDLGWNTGFALCLELLERKGLLIAEPPDTSRGDRLEQLRQPPGTGRLE
jgi:hypothetical protein